MKKFGTQAFWTESRQPNSKEIFITLQKLIELKLNTSNENQFHKMKAENYDFVQKHCSIDNTAQSLSNFFGSKLNNHANQIK